MTVTEVLAADEVVIDDVAYPLAPGTGGVGVQNITPFPEKIVFGDFTRSNDPLASNWVLTDWTGGFGKRRLKADTDIDRFWNSTGDTRYPTEFKLAPLANSMRAWTGYPANADSTTPSRVYVTGAVELVDANDTARPTRLLVAFWDPTVGGGALLRYVDFTHEAWVDPFVGSTGGSPFPAEATYTPGSWAMGNLIERPTWAVMDDRFWLIFPSQSGILFRSNVWYGQTGNTSTGNPCPQADRVVCWDAKLFGLESHTGRFWMITSIQDHVTSPSAWTLRASLPARAYDCQHLTIYRNSAGEPTVHAICREAIFAYDYAADTWVGPLVKYPRQIRSGQAFTERQQTLYIGGGTSTFGYDTNTFRDMGYGKDWGLPPARSGPINTLADAVNWLAAGTDTTVPGRTVAANVLLRDEVGWHHFWQSATTNTNVTWLHHSYADTRARLFWCEQGTVQTDVYYADMPLGVFNPRDSETSEYAETAVLDTGWFDGNWQEQGKCAFSLAYRTEDCSDTETVALYYALDDDESEDAWVLIGTRTENGAGAFALGDVGFGVPFRTIRLRIVLSRGTTTTITPVLRALVLRFARRPPPTYGYTFSVVVPPEGHAGQTAAAMEAALEALLDAQTESTLAFRRADRPVGTAPDGGVFNTHWAAQLTDEGGRYQLAFAGFGA